MKGMNNSDVVRDYLWCFPLFIRKQFLHTKFKIQSASFHVQMCTFPHLLRKSSILIDASLYLHISSETQTTRTTFGGLDAVLCAKWQRSAGTVTFENLKSPKNVPLATAAASALFYYFEIRLHILRAHICLFRSECGVLGPRGVFPFVLRLHLVLLTGRRTVPLLPSAAELQETQVAGRGYLTIPVSHFVHYKQTGISASRYANARGPKLHALHNQ